MAVFMDLKGTSQSSFQIAKGGPKLINNGFTLLDLRNAANSAYVNFQANVLQAAADAGLILNSDAAGSGADWQMLIARPATGMTAAVTYTLPAVPVNGYYLQTDASGNLSWAAVTSPSVSEKVTVDTTTVAFGDSTPIAAFTLPANAVVHKVDVIIDTPFNGTSPALEVGISGTPDKYAKTSDSDIASGVGDRWESHPNEIPVGSSEAIEIGYVSGSSTAGSARVLVHYSIPA